MWWGRQDKVTNEMAKPRREVVRHITHTLVVTLSCPEHCSIWKHFVPGMPNKPASTGFSLCHCLLTAWLIRNIII